jgi:hypothetical protein
MKKIKSIFSTWIGLLTVCLLPVGARAEQHFQSGIIGLVDPNSYNTIWISDGSNLFISVPIDADGFFEVDLEPGRYTLKPLFIEPVEPSWGPPYGAPIQVKVTGHHFKFVKITELPIQPGLLP